MARIRSVHPGFFSSRYAGLPDPVQLLFLGLLCRADDQGVFDWDPMALKIAVRPGSHEHHSDIEMALQTLQTAGAIRRFMANGRAYGGIRNFVIHQRMKKPSAVHPCPPHIRAFVGFGEQGERLRSTIQARNLASTNCTADPEPVPNQFGTFPADNWKGNKTPYQEEERVQDRSVREGLTETADADSEFE